jgi:hypothetical protein
MFKPSGTLAGRLLDEMKENYEQQRVNLMSVPSTREPQEIPASQIIRGLNAV